MRNIPGYWTLARLYRLLHLAGNKKRQLWNPNSESGWIKDQSSKRWWIISYWRNYRMGRYQQDNIKISGIRFAPKKSYHSLYWDMELQQVKQWNTSDKKHDNVSKGIGWLANVKANLAVDEKSIWKERIPELVEARARSSLKLCHEGVQHKQTNSRDHLIWNLLRWPSWEHFQF